MKPLAAKTPHGSLNEAPRCGRCAQVLPDETLTFCPTCGVPFSRVPPTNAFSHLAERFERHLLRKKQWQLVGISLGLVLFFWSSLLGLSELERYFDVQKMATTREIHFYISQDPRYPALKPAVVMDAVSVALQAFHDHFGVELDQFRVSINERPAQLAKYWDWEKEPYTELSFWEKTFFPAQISKWASDPQAILPVFIENSPLKNDLGATSSIPTQHLGAKGLISGLAHPSFVVISTYRLFQEQKILFGAGASDAARARFLGEYVLAHELGHALLGLSDYIIASPSAGRVPASAFDFGSCLMHTDEGGGYSAWHSLKERKLGQKLSAPCQSYAELLEGVQLRQRAIAQLKIGHREQGEKLHSLAIEKIRAAAQPWMVDEWQKEHSLYLSALQRWWDGVFMF